MKKLRRFISILLIIIIVALIGAWFCPWLRPMMVNSVPGQKAAALWHQVIAVLPSALVVEQKPTTAALAAPESSSAPASEPAQPANSAQSDETPQSLVGDLPASPLSDSGFNPNMLFGFADPKALLVAVHQKTLQILDQGNNLKPEVLQLALRAYACAHAQNIGKPRYLTIIDYSLPSTEKRMWVIDLKTATVSFHTLVAHGKNSGFINTTNFSNTPSSDATSIGLFLTADTYTGHNGYSLKLVGLEPGFNDNALQRDVVIHGAAYVSDDFVKKYGRLGRSWGCPALSKLVATPIIDEIKNGFLVFSYYPQANWIKGSTYLHCKVELPWSW